MVAAGRSPVAGLVAASTLPSAIQAWQMVASAGERDDARRCAPFHLEQRLLPLPALAPGEALVQIAGCGICGTDLGYFYDGILTVSRPPLTLGHEISGTVVAGDASWVGKKVIVPTILPCRSCGLCGAGRANRCLSQKMPGNSYGSYGGFASHIPVPTRELCEVPEQAGIPLELLAVVADAVATPYQAALRGGLQRGDRVIIVGVTGGLGIYMAQWAKLLGADYTIDVEQEPDPAARILDYTGGEGVNVVVNVTGGGKGCVEQAVAVACLFLRPAAAPGRSAGNSGLCAGRTASTPDPAGRSSR